MGIYQPFTYHLFHKPTGKHYYGVRFRKGCHPGQLWTTYFSSSKIVKQLIKDYGKDSFQYEIRRVFDTAESAVAWETKVLKRLRVKTNDNWLNLSIQGAVMMTDDIKAKISAIHKGRTKSPEERRKQSLARKGKKQSKDHAMKRGAARKGLVFSDEWRQNLKASCKHRKRWNVLSPTSEPVEITNLIEFCADNHLSYQCMLHVLNGRNKSHKGFTRAPVSESQSHPPS